MSGAPLLRALAISMAFAPTCALAQTPAIDGAWINHARDAVVVIAPCAEAPSRRCGRISWVSPGVANGQQALGVTVFRHFSETQGGTWRGDVFDPESGDRYTGALTLDRAGKLRVRSCLGPACETEIWSRAPG